MGSKPLTYLFLVLFIVVIRSNAQSAPAPIPYDAITHHTDNATKVPMVETILQPGARFMAAGSLSFIAAAISSAGGIGGGGLFVPILIIVAGLDVKTAASYSAFMVTGGSIANVATHILARGGSTKARIDYDIALLSEPAMLLGVSVGVILNQVLPEWLVTVLFAVFVAFCTFKTCQSGVSYWQLESEAMTVSSESTKRPLLNEGGEKGKLGIPWMKLGMLVAVWVSFFLLYVLRGNRFGQGVIRIEVCGKAYWIILLMQIPLAIIFTTWILFGLDRPKNHGSIQQEMGDLNGSQPSCQLIFPVMALLAGLLGGVFGIGGGMLISPLLLQVGIEPEMTAATCSFMVLFSSTMSAIQYLLLGMEQICGAVILSSVCFVASLIGLTIVQQAIVKHGRASIIVFSVGTVMALSTLVMTSFGAMETWRDYANGQSMWFNRPC